MLWVLLSLLTALSESFKDLFSKRLLNKGADYFLIAWTLHFCSFLFLLPAIGMQHGMISITASFVLLLVVVSLLNGGVTILYMLALRKGELSEVVPLLSLTPLFMLFTSPIIVGDYPTWIGSIGVLLIVIGAYILYYSRSISRWFYPFLLLFQKQSARIMLLIAFIWSITGNLDKIGVQQSSPLLWGILTNGCISLFLFPLLLSRKSEVQKMFHTSSFQFLLIGIFAAIVVVTQMTAITLTLVPYVIAIKRLSILFGVLWGGIFLKEKAYKQRFFAASLMVCGAVLLILS